jgi:hypothetical protein
MVGAGRRAELDYRCRVRTARSEGLPTSVTTWARSGAANTPLTEWQDYRSRPSLDTVCTGHRGAVTASAPGDGFLSSERAAGARPCVLTGGRAPFRRRCTRITVIACHGPPPGVGTLRSFSSRAIARAVMPANSARIGRRLRSATSRARNGGTAREIRMARAVRFLLGCAIAKRDYVATDRAIPVTGRSPFWPIPP